MQAVSADARVPKLKLCRESVIAQDLSDALLDDYAQGHVLTGRIGFCLLREFVWQIDRRLHNKG
jgi:hypothetical protein